jgi:hypothetical protein
VQRGKRGRDIVVERRRGLAKMDRAFVSRHGKLQPFMFASSPFRELATEFFVSFVIVLNLLESLPKTSG